MPRHYRDSWPSWYSGIVAYRSLPVSDLPTIDAPTIQVQVTLPGASADTMAATIALPLEKRFTTIAGIDSMSSNNIAWPHLHHSACLALNETSTVRPKDVQAAIILPDEVFRRILPIPPTFQQGESRRSTGLYIAGVAPTTLPMSKVDYYAENLIIPVGFDRQTGVSQAMVYDNPSAMSCAPKWILTLQAASGRSGSTMSRKRSVNDERLSLPTGERQGTPADFDRPGNRSALQCGRL